MENDVFDFFLSKNPNYLDYFYFILSSFSLLLVS